MREASPEPVVIELPMNAAPSPNTVEDSLEIIAKYVPISPAESPAQFVIELAQHWKARGGLLAGKPRHSDRYLSDLLRQNGKFIRSLTPKLAGKTNLRPGDAEDLVRLFLSHWEYNGDPYSGEISARSADQYTPLLLDADIEQVCAYVAERIEVIGAEPRMPPSESEATPSPLLGEDTIELIAKEFRESAALVSASTGKPVLVPSERQPLLGFKDLMDKLWAVERADGRGRILVWTLDLGRQVFEDPGSIRKFMEVQELVTRFKALQQFEDSAREARWDWLQSKAIVVLQDSRRGRPDVPRPPTFYPHHVQFDAIPPKWAGSREFIDLYGREAAQGNYSIFLKRFGQSPEHTRLPSQRSAVGQLYTLRYFGHALKPDENGTLRLRGLQLESLDWSYIEALGTVLIAANQMLDLQTVPAALTIDRIEIDPVHVIEKLRYHGFRLLRLDEFVQF
jgi:hypothetical protein